MKKIADTLIILIIPLLFGCTHNNGDIGDWFGTWKLQSIEINGAEDQAYKGDILWKFQNNIISMVCADDIQHTADCRYGTWEQAGDRLFLDFSHSDDRYEQGQGQYEPLPQTYIRAGKTELTVISLSGSELRLQMAVEEGAVYSYYFKKWG